jgi:RHS repeat-associated protein
VNLLDYVEWNGVGGATRTESYTYASIGHYFYPYFTEPQPEQDVLFLASVTRPGGFTTAYDYACTEATNNEMSQVDLSTAGDGSFNWQLKLGARLSDIYYPTGLRSHYEYAQDQFNYSSNELDNDLPHPPGKHPIPGQQNHFALNTLLPDKENWVYHAGVGVILRKAFVWNPGLLPPFSVPSIMSLNEGQTNVTTLSWTWNRYGVRELFGAEYGKPPYVVTGDPLGKELIHGFGYFSYVLDYDSLQYNYSSIASLETTTAVYSKFWTFKTQANNSWDWNFNYLVKKTEQYWQYAKIGAANIELGDIQAAGFVLKADSTFLPVEGGNPSISRISSFILKNGNLVNIAKVDSTGWDGYGHYEQMTVTGLGIPGYSGSATNFASYRLLTGHMDNYRVDQPQASGTYYPQLGTKSASLAALGFNYTYYDDPNPPIVNVGVKVSSVNKIRNAKNTPTPQFWVSSGRLKFIEAAWLSSGTTGQDDGDVSESIEIDSQGNVHKTIKSTFFPLDAASTFETIYTYDPDTGSPLSATIGGKSLGTQTYDDSTGLPITQQDSNQVGTTIEYDSSSDRPKKIAPSTSLEAPTWFYYSTESGGSGTLLGIGASVSFDSVLTRVVKHRGASSVGSTTGDYLAAISSMINDTAEETVTDGLGRTVVKRTLTGDLTAISAIRTAYGPDGSMVFTSLPYIESGNPGSQTLSFPVAFRNPLSTTNPDGTLTISAAVPNVPGTYNTIYQNAVRGSYFPAVLSGETWAFDCLGRPLKTFFPTTSSTVGDATQSFAYSPSGLTRMVTAHNISGTSNGVDYTIPTSTTAYYYNALGHLIGVDAPGTGADAIYDYDVNGKVHASRLVGQLPGIVTLPPGDPVNPLTDPIQTTGFLGLYSASGTNSGINCASGGQVRTFTYDGLGRLLKTNDSAESPVPTLGLEQGPASNYFYNALGQVLESQDALGAASPSYKLQYSYDNMGRLLQINKKPSGPIVLLAEFMYDTYATGDDVFSGTSYTGANAKDWKLTRSIYHNRYTENGTEKDVQVATVYRYAAPMGRESDKRTSITWPGATALKYEQDYVYNQLGEVYYILLPEGQTRRTTFTHGVPAIEMLNTTLAKNLTYNPAGRLTGMELWHETKIVGTMAMGYDAVKRLSSITLTPWTAAGGPAPTWAQDSFSYDGAGEITAIGNGTGRDPDMFRYDALGRLVKAQTLRRAVTSSGVEYDKKHFFLYGYDLYGNLTSRSATESWIATTQPSASILSAYLLNGMPSGFPDVNEFMKMSVVQIGIPNNTNKIATATHGPPSPPSNPPPQETKTYQHDPRGFVVKDRLRQYEYDALGRNTATKDQSATPIYLERNFYDASGERVERVYNWNSTLSPPQFADVADFVRSNGEVLWETGKDIPTIGVDRKSYLNVAGRLVAMNGYGISLSGGGGCRICPVPTPEMMRSMVIQGQGIPEGQEPPPPAICIPEMSAPSWTPTKGGSHQDLSYDISNLCDDVVWIEVRKSRIKDHGNSPCNGNSCEDQVEIQHHDQPAGGWADPLPLTFADLQGDKMYQVAMSFASTAAGHPALGPMTISGGVELLQCPKGTGSTNGRARMAHRNDGTEEVYWRFSAEASNYTVKGTRNGQEVVLGISGAGEDVFVSGQNPNLEGLSSVSILPGDGGNESKLPGLDGIIIIGPPGTKPRKAYPAKFFATDHVGTVRATYSAYPPPSLYGSGVQWPSFMYLTLDSTSDYDPFGLQLYPGDPSTNADPNLVNTNQYTGQERDRYFTNGNWSTGNDNMHFRFYQDAIGRFLRPDNIAGNPANPQSWNRYSYCLGNPTSFTDPTGHVPASGPGNQAFKYGVGFMGLFDHRTWESSSMVFFGASDIGMSGIMTTSMMPQYGLTARLVTYAYDSCGNLVSITFGSPVGVAVLTAKEYWVFRNALNSGWVPILSLGSRASYECEPSIMLVGLNGTDSQGQVDYLPEFVSYLETALTDMGWHVQKVTDLMYAYGSDITRLDIVAHHGENGVFELTSGGISDAGMAFGVSNFELGLLCNPEVYLWGCHTFTAVGEFWSKGITAYGIEGYFGATAYGGFSFNGFTRLPGP